MHSIRRHLVWLVVALVGAFALGTVALSRGESINALWIVTAAICVYLIAYRYYSLFIANKVLGLDGTRKTPARNARSETCRRLVTVKRDQYRG